MKLSLLSTGHAGAIGRVLRCKHTGEYFTGEGWTADIEKARRFSDSLEAAQACARLSLTGVEMVLRVNGSDTDLFVIEMCARSGRKSFPPMSV